MNTLIIILTVALSSASLASLKEAKSYFSKRQYGRAAESYYDVFSTTRSSADKKKAEYGLALSLQESGLLYSASKYYSIIVRRGRSKSNPYFRNAMEALGNINSTLSLGRSHIVKLFKTKIRLSDVPGSSRGFYFYYKGVEAFEKSSFEIASKFFDKVPSSSDYYYNSLFHQGVIANISGNHSRSIAYFEKVIAGTKSKTNSSEVNEMSIMNIARVYYERKDFTKAISYYGRIPRNSVNWLDALWESSWAFFFMEKLNNSLGNIHTIHSPFFSNRFYPESFILQAITYLRLCHYDEVSKAMGNFKRRYAPVFRDVKAMLKKYKGDAKGFYKLIYDYRNGKIGRFMNAEQIIKRLSLIDDFKGAQDTMRFADREINLLRKFQGQRSAKLQSSLKAFLSSKKKAAISAGGRLLYREAKTYYAQLLSLSNQSRLIVAEMQLGKLQKLRSMIGSGVKNKKIDFIGGLQTLKLNETLEYWPFEGEYWEDELGFYVYNLNSKCKKAKGE